MMSWTPRLVALIVVLDFRCRFVVTEMTDSSLVTHAQSIYDLRHVLGPNYRLFVTAYWRYMSLSCSFLTSKITQDWQNGYLEKYCMHLNRCPTVYPTQSCLVQISAYSISMSCCREPTQVMVTVPEQPTASTRPPISEDLSKTAFNLTKQQICGYGKVLPSGKIFGGAEAKHGEFPWTIMLMRNQQPLCGGVLLSATYALTTAHCFDSHISSYHYDVIAGKHSLGKTDSTEQTAAVKAFVIHEQYNQFTSWNDLALLVLAEPLTFNDYVLPACLPSASDKLEQFCTVAGWGKTEGEAPPSVLMKVELQTYNRSQCYNEFKDTANNLEIYLSDGAICAANGKLGQKDACKGDSGSPLMCIKSTQSSIAWFVFGIVSNGNECALPGDPGIYVNIQHYLDWINTTIKKVSLIS